MVGINVSLVFYRYNNTCFFSAVLVNSYLLQSIMYYQSEIKYTVRALDQLIELPTVWIINRP
jgi:hypothetical protein